MKKKFISLAMALSFVLSIGVTAHAEVKEVDSKVIYEQQLSPEAQKIVDEANADVQNLISKAKNKANKLNENSKNYDKELDKIIKKLQNDAKKVTDKGISKLAKLGVYAECEYIYIDIGNRKDVPVDPIKVIL